MAFGVSPGVYSREIDRSFISTAVVGNIGGVVITSDKGPMEPTLVTSQRRFIELFGEPSKTHPSKYAATRYLARSPLLVACRVQHSTEADQAEVATGSLEIDGTADALQLEADNPGDWGNNIRVSFAEVDYDSDVHILNVNYTQDGEEQVVESYEFSFVEDKKDGFGQPLFIEDRIANSDYISFVDFDDSVDATAFDPTTDEITFGGGTNGATSYDTTDVASTWDKFSNTDEIDVNYLINAGFADHDVHSKMDSIARARKDAVAILDMPEETDVSTLTTFREESGAVSSTWSGYYAGWLKIADQFTGKQIFIPPSGDVAAVFSNTQTESNPWDAPAGIRRGTIPNVIGINKVWSESERDTLYPKQINPIQAFDGQGIVIWGQRTAQAVPSALDRFNVRLLFNYIRTNLVFSLRPFVMQGNTEFTRNSVKTLVDNFMEEIRGNGGVYNFQTNIDGPTTPEAIDRGEMIIELYIQPTRTAEFISLQQIALPTSADL